MIFWCMIIFFWVNHLQAMQPEIDPIDHDYKILIPFIIQVLERTKNHTCPAELFSHLKKSPDIDTSIPCIYCPASVHINAIITKQTIRMACDYHSECGDKRKLNQWFIPYFQEKIVPRMITELKKERDEKRTQNEHSSSGI